LGIARHSQTARDLALAIKRCRGMSVVKLVRGRFDQSEWNREVGARWYRG
jgi:hypothetical protein